MHTLPASQAVHQVAKRVRLRVVTTTLATVVALPLLFSACADRAVTEAQADGAQLEIVSDVDPRSLILVDPSAAVLHVNEGIIMRARVLDAEGNVVASARPAWRTSDASIALPQSLPDSAAAPGARVAVAAVSPGEALIIATFENLADTTVVTVRATRDSNGTVPPPPPPAPRPLAFDASITVLGFVPGADTSSTGSLALPGATVTLTLLPPQPGDSLPSGVTPVATATVFGTVTVNSESRARFTSVPQSRFRVDVSPPPGSAWQSASFTSAPPQVASYARIVTLRRP